MKEKISIIIPTYNRAATIEDSIKSVLNQTYENIEIVVADDCSTDNTEQIVKALNDDRIVYKKLDENKGAAGARNEGVKAATSNIIAFHDSDDICSNDRIEKEYEYWNKHPEYDLIYSSCRFKLENGESFIFPPENTKEKLHGNIFSELLIRNTVACPTVMMRRDDFLEVGGFDESYRCLEDWEFIIRFSKNHNIGYYNKPTITTFPQSGGLSSDKEKFYNTRARIIVQTKDMLDEQNIFDKAVLYFFDTATKDGNLEYAKACLMRALYKKSMDSI